MVQGSSYWEILPQDEDEFAKLMAQHASKPPTAPKSMSLNTGPPAAPPRPAAAPPSSVEGASMSLKCEPASEPLHTGASSAPAHRPPDAPPAAVLSAVAAV